MVCSGGDGHIAWHVTIRTMHPRSLLEACTELLTQALRFDSPADTVVSRYFKTHRQLGSRERAVLAQTMYAVLRRKTRYETLARSGSGARARRLAILGWPQQEAGWLHAALSPAEQDWLRQAHSVTDADLLPQHHHNLPQWLADALVQQLGQGRFASLSHSLLEEAPLDLRVNTIKARRADVQQALAAAGVESTPTPWSPWGLRVQGKPALTRLALFQNGSVEVQDEGSQLLALLLDAHRGEMVADFCAGAGGKTLALGAAMRNTGRLYAFDVSAHRLDKLKPRLARSGLSNVHPIAIAHERDERIKRLSGKMQRVLVDAPCSGLGTLRRNPDLKWRQTPTDVQELAAKQQAILSSAARLLKPGGRLVYATCSILPQENEAIAQSFLAAQPDMQPLNAAELLAALKVPDAAALCSPADEATQTPAGRYLRLWPDLHGTDGFFAAVWEKAT